MLLVFKRSTQGAVESMVQYLSGPMVHVDMIPLATVSRRHDEEATPPPSTIHDDTWGDDEADASYATKPSPSDDAAVAAQSAYTSYMFERFSRNAIVGAYSPDTHTALYVPLSTPQLHRAHQYLEACVERSVPYNYTDIAHCVIPGSSLVLTDVPRQQAEPPPTLFCSQAAVLCLRHAMLLPGPAEAAPIEAALCKLNSRVASPSALYNALKDHAIQIDLSEPLTPPDAVDMQAPVAAATESVSDI